jgi:hypothetical protein
MKNDNRVPTTVKVDTNLYDELKVLRVRHKFTFQSFVEKCMYLYVKDDAFRASINNFNLPILSTTGSL